ncbi:MAG TPA: BACON domain-containing carbohydrate-binding protein, partial [Verrucomicrobiae bacterium]|nr:BACON domain-containing carbohydrate-binding protein [Verrucomicrobiae bacterium]
MNIKGLVLAGLAWLALGAELAHAAPTILGTYQLWEGPMMGSDSVVLAVPSPTDAWTAMANAGWLHLSGTNQNGTASGTLGFSFDSNSGGTRSGTLTIAGQTLTITQAGATYVPAGSLTSTGSSYTSHGTVTPLVSSGLNQPRGVAVDGVGNLYIADTGNNMIKKWIEANGTVTTLVSSGLNNPFGVAVDGMGNVYIADTGNNAIKEWTIATSNLTTLVTNVDSPYALAVDRSGNVYITDSYDDVVYEWMVGNSNLVTLTSLPVPYICGPPSVAVDIAGNVYYDDTCGGGLDEWTATNGEVYSLTPGWFANPTGVGVGGSGNVYIADQADDWIWEWSAANNALTVAGSGCNRPFGVAVDGSGNVYIADTDNNAIDELPQVLLDPTPRVEGLAAGNDALPVVLPATASLLGVFAPISDQPWLTITGITNGVVGFAFSATTSNRTGTLRLLGHTIPVTQRGPSDSLGRTALLVGPNAGTDSVILDIYPYSNVWTAVANTNWLHLRSTNQSGAGSSIVIFSFDANMGPTRSGTFTIAGQILTVTQAGATYVAAGTLTTLVSSGLVAPNGLAVDGAGNVYIADEYQEAIKKWTASSNILTSLVSGLSGPNSVAVDSAGDNVYFTSGGSILKWAAANNTVTMLVPSGGDLGLDVFGNIYFSDGSTIQEWMVASSNVLTLVSSGGGPLAVDPGGNNVYFNTGTSIQNWTAGNNTVNTVAPLGGNSLAMDGSGNFYSANSDAYDGLYTLQKWTAASNTTTTLVSYHNGLYYGLSGVTVDSTGN